MGRLAETLGFELTVYPETVITREDAQRAVAAMEGEGIDFLLVQHTSYTPGHVSPVLAKIKARVGYWAIPEGEREGVVPFNSFCSVNMHMGIVAHYLRDYRIKIKWFFGDVEDPRLCPPSVGHGPGPHRHQESVRLPRGPDRRDRSPGSMTCTTMNGISTSDSKGSTSTACMSIPRSRTGPSPIRRRRRRKSRRAWSPAPADSQRRGQKNLACQRPDLYGLPRFHPREPVRCPGGQLLAEIPGGF